MDRSSSQLYVGLDGWDGMGWLSVLSSLRVPSVLINVIYVSGLSQFCTTSRVLMLWCLFEGNISSSKLAQIIIYFEKLKVKLRVRFHEVCVT